MPDKPSSPRQYPKFWEKAVPIILVILLVGFVALLAIIFLVAAGILKGV